MDDFSDKKFDLAIKGFEAYLARVPTSGLVPDLVPEAYFWLGASYYFARDYARAIKAFDEVIKKYPYDAKVVRALFQQGAAYLKLGEKERARAILNEVITRFPKSEEAGMARQTLNEAGLSPSPTSPQVPSPPAIVPPVITPPVVTTPRLGSVAPKEDGGLKPEVVDSRGVIVTNYSVWKPDPQLAYYFVHIQDKITGNWTPPKIGPGTTAGVNLALRILRSGQVRDLAVDTSSGDRHLDDSALRAVRLSTPLPPLPTFYKAETLYLQLRFTFRGEKN